MLDLYSHQKEALQKLRNGSVLVGGTGSGKSLVGLAYFYTRVVRGSLDPLTAPDRPVDIYVLTTARKRDDLDWVREAAGFMISTNREASVSGISLTVDSWNNIKKYIGIRGCFFLFDEQKTTGYGAWSKSFLKIAKNNEWLMLSATPADRWIDLLPVFIANGYYKSKLDFIRQHVVYSPHVKYPKILRYTDTALLAEHRRSVYVTMPHKKHAKSHVIYSEVEYDAGALITLRKTEWNPFTNKPIKTDAEYNYTVRRIVNSDPSRARALVDIHRRSRRLIVFYNFDFELEILKHTFVDICTTHEYNGHTHQPLPDGDCWVYLVQYLSGNEAWECFTTNHMAFFSMNYSYRIMTQAKGRIDRLTTTYDELYYHILVSRAAIDSAIKHAYSEKRDFNESGIRY